jgi:hypothetical protein
MRFFSALLLVSFLSFISVCADATPLLSAEDAKLLQEIQSCFQEKGGRAVVQKYFYIQSDSIGPGLRLVASGDPEAVKLGVDVYGFTDAFLTERLKNSLAEALSKNPREVLKYVSTSHETRAYDVYNSEHKMEGICVPQMIETPNKEAAEILDRQERALDAVHDVALRQVKDHCLEVIGSYRKNLKNN